jgi:predicted ThiF/HesA family dinucleotide-utilizing enzyme
MGKYYENLETLQTLIDKLNKKHLLAEFVLACITIAKEDVKKTQHEIIKEAKKRWDK